MTVESSSADPSKDNTVTVTKNIPVIEEVSNGETVRNDFIEEIKEFSKIVSDNAKKLEKYQNMDENLAFDLVTVGEKKQEMVRALMHLQQVYGLSLSIDPESIYSSEFKEHSVIYEKIAKVASKLSDIIDVTLRIWGSITSTIPSYQTSPKRCHTALTANFGEVEISFHGLLLQVISNCHKIIGFLDTIERGEVFKARIGMLRQNQMGEDIPVKKESED